MMINCSVLSLKIGGTVFLLTLASCIKFINRQSLTQTIFRIWLHSEEIEIVNLGEKLLEISSTQFINPTWQVDKGCYTRDQIVILKH